MYAYICVYSCMNKHNNRAYINNWSAALVQVSTSTLIWQRVEARFDVRFQFRLLSVDPTTYFRRVLDADAVAMRGLLASATKDKIVQEFPDVWVWNHDIVICFHAHGQICWANVTF
jgi:hypothetical protein